MSARSGRFVVVSPQLRVVHPDATRWWDQPRIAGKQGSLARMAGREATIACPKCEAAPVVYNGNYFCDNWGDGCDWALAHPATTTRDREICDRIGIDYE